ncbi:hypothetical protein C5Y97_20265 [Blastopirellula marina]|uniref:DUF1559 domain-containing protein n=1 Tax=Blastopirellula marina TaxID=124 RepID=A0A2S8FHW4_9BACT|nr:hypothetical protein C5Y98_20255 [Blastopirellula marina]PTL43054.1 hypothetical protein C5Y97_20265 [Blastopirellula marina]
METRRCKKSGKFTLATLMGFIAVVGLLCLMINMAWQRTYGDFNDRSRLSFKTYAGRIGFAISLKSLNEPGNRLPLVNEYDEQGRPMHSWRVLLLPEMEAREFYDLYAFHEPWDSLHNLRLAENSLNYYESLFWQDDEANRKGLTPFRAIVSGDNKKTERLGDWGKNISKQNRPIIVLDFTNPVLWTQPDGITLEEIVSRVSLNDARMEGTLFIFADGSVKVLDEEDLVRLEAIAAEANGENAFDR